MILKLPKELIDIILLNLDNESLSTISIVSKQINEYIKNNLFLWRNKLKKEYQISVYSDNIIHEYLRVYKTLCVVCFNKTITYNPVAKRMVCVSCSKNYDNLYMISLTRARKIYRLTNIDFKKIESHNIKRASVNYTYFTKKSIVDYISDSYGWSEWKKMLDEKKKKVFNRRLNRIIRYRILLQYLITIGISEIDLMTNIVPNIESYTRLYKKYLNGSVELYCIVLKCLELHYLITNTDIDNISRAYNDPDYFENSLTKFIFRTVFTPLSTFSYINNFISYITIKNKEKIVIKNNILKYCYNRGIDPTGVLTSRIYNSFIDMSSRILEIKASKYFSEYCFELWISGQFSTNILDIIFDKNTKQRILYRSTIDKYMTVYPIVFRYMTKINHLIS